MDVLKAVGRGLGVMLLAVMPVAFGMAVLFGLAYFGRLAAFCFVFLGVLFVAYYIGVRVRS